MSTTDSNANPNANTAPEPSIRIRHVRVTARALRRHAERLGLAPACAWGLAHLCAAMTHRGHANAYATVSLIADACASSPRVAALLEAA